MSEVENIINSIIDDDKPVIKENFDREMWEDFVVEAREHIENIEKGLLELETDKENENIINSIFRSFHTIKGLAGFVDIAFLVNISHETESLLDKARKKEFTVNKKAIDLFLKSSDIIKNITENINMLFDGDFMKVSKDHIAILKKFLLNPEEDNSEKNSPETDKKIGEILEDMGVVEKETLNSVLEKQKTDPDFKNKKIGEILLEDKKINTQDIITAIRKQEKSPIKNISIDDYIRVSSSKIENLLNLVGELMIIESQIDQEFQNFVRENHSTMINLSRMLKLTKDIQTITMSMQMVPLKSTFQKINRIARDTINTLSKKVDFEITGEETEIDKAVAEKILDPLLHMIKNSISHGIEDEETRLLLGKSAVGKVFLKAYSNRGNVYIEVTDDGKGLDTEKIYKKALEKNLISSEKTYTDEEILDFIYLPGFSTVEKVNSISGRGVGMDVVKTEMTKIGGKIQIINSIGKGCSFILKIPINLAAMNGTILEIIDERYIIPTLYIKKYYSL